MSRSPVHPHPWLKLVCAFLGGLLLVTLPLIGQGHSFGKSDLLAPVIRPPAADLQLPTPLPRVSVPAEVAICLEPGGLYYDLFATVEAQGKHFYLLGIYDDERNTNPPNPLNTHSELIETNSETGCRRLVGSQSTPRQLSVYLPTAAAQALELQRYEHYISVMGSSQLQRRLSRAIQDAIAAGDRYLLSQEAIQALHQLHIQLPAGYDIFRASPFP
ncbi:hypothetical protein H6F67_11035 [Microcoleus sp. FACHB-1515]|uniref:hypothetical protein n=1 Tax=Cyanophyceae TaxID=3028117 RepID=UPI001684C8E9|nr:hypothetical protein [Microcoleus sp. FACHB-1515]MBD2090388.1 hypothetical protein [Microcoleus sp. FACHB-1515]